MCIADVNSAKPASFALFKIRIELLGIIGGFNQPIREYTLCFELISGIARKGSA